jgi:hypothetical protein
VTGIVGVGTKEQIMRKYAGALLLLVVVTQAHVARAEVRIHTVVSTVSSGDEGFLSSDVLAAIIRSLLEALDPRY